LSFFHVRKLKSVAINYTTVFLSSYFVFNENQKEIVKQYPGMIEEELIKYEEKILNYFSVSKQMPKITSQVRPVPISTNELDFVKSSQFFFTISMHHLVIFRIS
jgi:hypothetical protein